MILNKIYIDELIKSALLEDINYIDIATDLLIDQNQNSNAVFLSKADGIICGIEVALRVFKLLDESFSATIHFKDGDKISNGDVIASLKGKTSSLLKGERTALNILQHMSGIATATSKLVSLCESENVTISDTRKTLPGLRAIEKYAVLCGNGKNHRYNLSDCAMLKNNHIDACGGIIPAVKKVRDRCGHTVKIEVETRNLEEVKEATECQADIIMLDNMSLSDMRAAKKLVKNNVLLEASGGVNERTIKEIAEIGIDIISVGSITHSVKALDISMKIQV